MAKDHLKITRREMAIKFALELGFTKEEAEVAIIPPTEETSVNEKPSPEEVKIAEGVYITASPTPLPVRWETCTFFAPFWCKLTVFTGEETPLTDKSGAKNGGKGGETVTEPAKTSGGRTPRSSTRAKVKPESLTPSTTTTKRRRSREKPTSSARVAKTLKFEGDAEDSGGEKAPKRQRKDSGGSIYEHPAYLDLKKQVEDLQARNLALTKEIAEANLKIGRAEGKMEGIQLSMEIRKSFDPKGGKD